MKGQFLLTSAILLGIIILSSASQVQDIKSTEFKPESTMDLIKNIERQAGLIDHSSDIEVREFRRKAESIPYSNANVTHWQSRGCFNATFSRPDENYRLECLG